MTLLGSESHDTLADHSVLRHSSKMRVVELCAGGGGQALGLEQAGFDCALALEIDPHACSTLRMNRPKWKVEQGDMRTFDGRPYEGVDLFAAGVPCPPFSVAGKQLGWEDERDLFPHALRLVRQMNPKAFLLENVAGFASQKFHAYRQEIFSQLTGLGYRIQTRLLNASDYGVPQLRPRFLIVGIQKHLPGDFLWPTPLGREFTAGEVLADLIAENGWPGAASFCEKAMRVAPTIVGGSKKHGGPDLGPTRAKRQWQEIGVDGRGIANDAPTMDFPSTGLPRLTLRMVARIQGFPDEWIFAGGKTAAYRQIGNAFPPPVARAVGLAIRRVLSNEKTQYPVFVDRSQQVCFLESDPKK